MTDAEQELTFNLKKFRSHRRLAAASLGGIGAILLVAVFWLEPEDVAHYDTIFSSAIYSFTGIVAVWMGATAWMEK